MNIQIYEVDQNGKVLATRVFEFSGDLFMHFAKSEFSRIGVSTKTPVVIDEEHAELKLVELSPFVRQALAGYLKDYLVDLLKDCLKKMGNSPSRLEYQEYTIDLKEMPDLIRCIEDDKYTHLNRMG
ncbi:hypothetical protein FIV02_14275 [Pseudomonas sp. THAF187a]|uniref:hypothetical protein n=1 Tax=unclassified Pseudomonas TaxID=196821 RepID=UPI0012685E1D|nr:MULTISPECIES: hypothetical protein [unclassified Pseudomonas]QFT22737.1 hypothetical protein FIV02_14275 [Pseudomonas sp. THAF187a]QFT42924.1 hypothetical protein FIU98_14255 [Pseudomonas sp. THAF42]